MSHDTKAGYKIAAQAWPPLDHGSIISHLAQWQSFCFILHSSLADDVMFTCIVPRLVYINFSADLEDDPEAVLQIVHCAFLIWGAPMTVISIIDHGLNRSAITTLRYPIYI